MKLNLLIVTVGIMAIKTRAFAPNLASSRSKIHILQDTKLFQKSILKVPEDVDTVIPFFDLEKNQFIECYADSIATVDGEEYTIGSPCDTSVAICYFDENEELIPIELDSELMDDIFPQAAAIVEDEFGEELSLERTPQTLTLVGELDTDDDEEEEEEEEDDDLDDDEEEVEILLSFEEDDIEYLLVRLLDPVLLVGKSIKGEKNKCELLSPDESEKIMPILEDLFLEYQEKRDSMET